MRTLIDSRPMVARWLAVMLLACLASFLSQPALASEEPTVTISDVGGGAYVEGALAYVAVTHSGGYSGVAEVQWLDGEEWVTIAEATLTGGTGATQFPLGYTEGDDPEDYSIRAVAEGLQSDPITLTLNPLAWTLTPDYLGDDPPAPLAIGASRTVTINTGVAWMDHGASLYLVNDPYERKGPSTYSLIADVPMTNGSATRTLTNIQRTTWYAWGLHPEDDPDEVYYYVYFPIDVAISSPRVVWSTPMSDRGFIRGQEVVVSYDWGGLGTDDQVSLQYRYCCDKKKRLVWKTVQTVTAQDGHAFFRWTPPHTTDVRFKVIEQGGRTDYVGTYRLNRRVVSSASHRLPLVEGEKYTLELVTTAGRYGSKGRFTVGYKDSGAWPPAHVLFSAPRATYGKAKVTVTAVVGRQYSISYEDGKPPSGEWEHTSYDSYITPTVIPAASVSFDLDAPARFPKGGKVTLDVEMTPALTGKAELWSSKDGRKWTKSSSALVFTDGSASRVLAPAGDRYYRVQWGKARSAPIFVDSVVPKLTLVASPSPYLPGGTSELSLTLNHAFSGSATLYSRAPGGKWKKSSTKTAIVDGTATRTVQPSGVRQYYFAFAGGKSNVVTLRPVVPTLILEADATEFTPGQTITLSLSSDPALSGKATVYYRKKSSGAWVKSSTVVTVMDGTASFSVKPPGYREYRLVFHKGTSNPVAIRLATA